MKKISICIPCYEMGGMGRSMLFSCLKSISSQDYISKNDDYEIIVSDDSEDKEVYCLCSEWKESVNLVYLKNKTKKGLGSNLNNAIRSAQGEIIKVLCQDDLLYGKNSLQKVVDNFDTKKGWLVTEYYHTYDRKNFFKLHKPILSKENIILDNTIGTHSCLSFLNEKVLEFDEYLSWYVDSEFYYRLFLRYGHPIIINEPCVAQLLWGGQVTNTLINEELMMLEFKYLKNKYGGYNGLG